MNCCTLPRNATNCRFFLYRLLETKATHLISNNNLDLHPSCKKNIDNGQKPRKHDGLINLKHIQLPARIQNNINILCEKYPFKDLKNNSDALFNYLWARNLPSEETDIKHNMSKSRDKILEKENININSLSNDELIKVELKIKNKVLKEMKKNIYNWKTIKYDAYLSMQYLLSRSDFDYSSTYRVLHELASRSKNFQPKTILHFGSGIGSSIWAANEKWGSKIIEHMCIDQSADMNTLARLLLQDGLENGEMFISGVYFRQFFPPSPKVKFDLVISAFSLFELPSRLLRNQFIENLWAKANNYLIIIENGTNAGFKIINEARESILKINSNKEVAEGHVFAPCPHDLVCPRVERNDGTPCNFSISHSKLNKPTNKVMDQYSNISYIVFQKGPRNLSETAWPRIVRPVKEMSKRVYVQTCSPDATLQFSVITASKNSKELYQCAKACQWGDLLPAITKAKNEPTAPSMISQTSSVSENKTISQMSSAKVMSQTSFLSSASEDETILISAEITKDGTSISSTSSLIEDNKTASL